MRVLIAGATGAIGRPLIGALRGSGHVVFALARSADSAREVAALGAEVVIADVLDAIAVKAAIMRAQPDAVINELTSLPRHYTAAEMAAAAERDRQVRIEGNRNLLAALTEVGVRRYLLQSSAYWYAPAPGLADEDQPFAFAASPAVAAGTRRNAELERMAAAAGVELVALRYGFFYGPGTWFDSNRRHG
jgi:nucleoside-diphosphate-sugar epimerase